MLFDSNLLIINKIFKNHKLERATKTEDNSDQDSNLSPDYINFSNSNKPTKQAPKINQEAVMPEED